MALAELEYDHTWHQQDFAGDEKLHVRFYQEVLPDPEASAIAGYRKFRDADIVSIVIPGDKHTVTIREVREDDKIRFAKKYEAYRAGQEDTDAGYPLKEWPLINRAMTEEFKYLGFHSVESIAYASDTTIGKYPGMREIQRRAQAWLAAQSSAAPLERLQSELASRDEKLAAQAAMLEEMQKALAELKAKK